MRPERAYALEALGRYWPRGGGAAADLGHRAEPFPETFSCPPRLLFADLPDWSGFADEPVPVPVELTAAGEGPQWARTNWLGAAWWHLSCAAERAFEEAHGPVHSSFSRLTGFDPRLYDRAWANRIALFLRAWAAREAGRDAADLFGPLPEAEWTLTHDLDALDKHAALRGKQTVFRLLAAAEAARRKGAAAGLAGLATALRFLLSSGRYDRLDEMADLARQGGFRSWFFVNAGKGRPKSALARFLIDPAYGPERPGLGERLARLAEDGFTVGLHPSFDTFASAEDLAAERARLERVVGRPVTAVRQHWLRFSFARTWQAQEEAGLALDSTLGFNARPGFRCGAALLHHPWDPSRRAPRSIRALPLVLMDSHLHEGPALSEEEMRGAIGRYVEEVRRVRGQAAFLWHPHVVSPDFGWGRGLSILLELLEDRSG